MAALFIIAKNSKQPKSLLSGKETDYRDYINIIGHNIAEEIPQL